MARTGKTNSSEHNETFAFRMRSSLSMLIPLRYLNVSILITIALICKHPFNISGGENILHNAALLELLSSHYWSLICILNSQNIFSSRLPPSAPHESNLPSDKQIECCYLGHTPSGEKPAPCYASTPWQVLLSDLIFPCQVVRLTPTFPKALLNRLPFLLPRSAGSDTTNALFQGHPNAALQLSATLLTALAFCKHGSQTAP